MAPLRVSKGKLQDTGANCRVQHEMERIGYEKKRENEREPGAR